MAKIVGVYSIQSISKPERIYIGSAGEKTGIYERWNTHILRLKQGNHHSKTLQRHYNKYGADDLVFEIIEDGVYISPQQLLAREQHWMYWFRYSKTWKPYFNALPIAGSGYGGKHSAKSRKRMSQQRKGKNENMEKLMKAKELINNVRYDNNLTEKEKSELANAMMILDEVYSLHYSE